jgi:3,4-dihydroxy 2-butanone 4-phosphate synthase/GTP cyclohydrolase II
MTFDHVEAAIEDIRQGKMVIVADDEDRENEGDLVCAAEMATPEIINFMATHGRGLICVALTRERADRLRLPLMTEYNTDPEGTAFTISVDGHRKHGVGTGISAHDRAKTIELIIDPETGPDDLRRPGHIFPLRAQPGGVLRRVGHTEAAVDLARLAGVQPAGVICEILNDDGSMARRPQLEVMAREFDLKFVTLPQLVSYRLHRERLVERVAEARLPTDHGVFQVIGYRSPIDSREHVALTMGDLSPDEETLVRMHSECLTGDVFASQRCDCGEQLNSAMRKIAERGKGAIVYLKQEGRGIGLHNKLKAYQLQDQGMDTVEANERLGFKADLRDYGIGAQILLDLGLKKIRLLTNNPRKIVGIDGYGLEVVGRESVQVEPGEFNESYLETKRTKLGHLL